MTTTYDANTGPTSYNEAIKAPPTLEQSTAGAVAPPLDTMDVAAIDPPSAMVVLLHGIWKQLLALVAGPQPFTLDVAVNTDGAVQRQTGTQTSGTLLCIHNPTAGALVVTLVDGIRTPIQRPIFNASLAAGESRQVSIAFLEDLCAYHGAGAVLSGTYRA